ncbi:hypothetical protein [Muricoccus radiodurans]|uniref:hypothetical protein n=1 Tax=Muricoccus radiodurans TaxID=2231721 RepID=UPI003CE8DD16
MAKVWVYSWNHVRGGTGAAWGHSSLQVESGPYISWWPSADGERDYLVDRNKHPTMAKMLGKLIGTTNIYKVKHRCNPTLQADNHAEGRPPDDVVEIANGVLNTGAIETWWRGYAYETASYHSLKKNCSTTVIRALRAGGSDKHVSVKKLGTKGKLGSIDFFSKQTGWEPTDIMAYLRLMNRSLGDAKVNMRGTASTTPPPRNEPVEGGVQMCMEHGQPLLSCTDC